MKQCQDYHDVRKTMRKFILTSLVILCSCLPNPAAQPISVPTSVGSIVRLDPAFDALVPASAHIEKLAGGFQFLT